jgi:hypothetical protein
MKHRLTRMGARGGKLAENCNACKRERNSSFFLSCFWCISWFLRRSQNLRRSRGFAAFVVQIYTDGSKRWEARGALQRF